MDLNELEKKLEEFGNWFFGQDQEALSDMLTTEHHINMSVMLGMMLRELRMVQRIHGISDVLNSVQEMQENGDKGELFVPILSELPLD